MPRRNFTGFLHPWSRDRNSAGMGANQPKTPHGTPMSITSPACHLVFDTMCSMLLSENSSEAVQVTQ